MGKINIARVILGGLLAGLVINISEYVLNTYVIADDAAAMLERFGLPQTGMHQIGVFLVMTFILGIIMVFTYAAMRPRFGAGVKTAIIAAVTLWPVSLFGTIVDGVLGIVPGDMLPVIVVWSLAEMVIGSVAGAWLYKEAAPGL
jgi:hypothetical protein